MIAEVQLWGTVIGAVEMARGSSVATFQYDSAFIESGIELSPIVMPLREQPYRFPNLSTTTFNGLPGLLADVLPDKFGNALINAWLAKNGRTPESFSAVDRLCYVGRRGMGALEFAPAVREGLSRSSKVEVDQLVELASEILSARFDFQSDDRSEDFADMLRVGTSAGGARAKAVIAWNPETHEVRSGQVDVGEGFSHWLIKFDGVEGNRDKEAFDAQGFGAIEYAYSLMAKAAGVTMTECRLLEEGGRRHFMTRRFDRLEGGGKLHMQTLGAIAHFDFNLAGGYSYEQAFQVIKQLEIPPEQLEQQ
ncbi:MAG TPA: HipA domain-containing protein, partial [Fimbriimonas sp.]|nr:HipA domain-containing protein [Fimbriimonas sp.]